MSSIYRGGMCPDCDGGGRITDCAPCAGNGTLICDLCNGTGARIAPAGGGECVPCVCQNGYFICAACSGGTGVCGRCGGRGS